mgnify:CR=1 FL=1
MLPDKSFNLDFFNPQEIAKQIALRVREKRLMLNLTQQALATKAGVSLGSLKRFENKYEISLQHLLLLAVVLQSSEEFSQLFSHTSYQSVDEVVIRKKISVRKRGRKNV